MYWMTAFAEMQKSAFCQLIVFVCQLTVTLSCGGMEAG